MSRSSEDCLGTGAGIGRASAILFARESRREPCSGDA
jgi:hypothetical protein